MNPPVAIEKGIPIPSRTGARSVLGKLIQKLRMGDSFVTDMQRESVYSLARYYGIRIAVRATGDGKMRVWRINKPITKQESEKVKANESGNKIRKKQEPVSAVHSQHGGGR